MWKLEFDNSKKFINVKCPKLSKKFGDILRFLLTSIPTAAEAAEVDVRADRRSPGRILPYRGKSVVPGNSKSRYPQSPHLHSILTNFICFFKISNKKVAPVARKLQL